MSGRRTAYAAACAGYDVEHERHLPEAVITAVAEASRLSDCNVMATRTAETASALISVLAMSPSATRSPTAIRKTIDELGTRLRRRFAAAEADRELQDFLRRVFHGSDAGGHT